MAGHVDEPSLADGGQLIGHGFGRLTLQCDQSLADNEIGREGFTYRLASGREGSVLAEQVLDRDVDLVVRDEESDTSSSAG